MMTSWNELEFPIPLYLEFSLTSQSWYDIWLYLDFSTFSIFVRRKFLLWQVFGLGNKTYEHYNAMGIYVDKRLEELGGERIFELGLGDDDAK